MKKLQQIRFLAVMLILALVVYACDSGSSDPEPTPPSGLTYSPNALQVNQGNAGNSATPSIQGSTPITYTIQTVNPVNPAITINGNTGVISVSNASATGSFKVSVKASNAAGSPIFNEVYTVTVNTVNLPPSNLVYSPNAFDVKEGAGKSSATPSIQGTQPITYSISNVTPANAEVTINANTGVITVSNSSVKGIFAVSVKAENAFGNQTFTNIYTAEVRSAVTFTANILTFVTNRCGPCHTTGSQPKWTNFNTAKNSIDNIITRVSNGSMPQGGPALTQAEIDIFKRWKADGTPEN
jgi:hypothetical protein